MKRYAALLILLISTVCGTWAQIAFKVNAPMRIAPGQKFNVEFVLTNATGNGFVQPKIANATVLIDAMLSTGSNTVIVNNQQITTSTQIYTYVLRAPQSGSITISAARILANGKTYSTTPVTIEVISGSSTGAANSSTGQQSGASLAANDILLRVDMDKKTVYKGQAITATLKLYTRVGIAGLENPKYAAFNGFWAQELDASKTQPHRATLAGKVYEGIPLRQWLLYPQKAGTLKIEQNSFTAIAQLVSQNSGNSLFDEFFGGGAVVEHMKKQVASPSFNVQILELPKPQPISFAGAVGKFTLQASISANTMSANSSGAIKIKLSGTGNFPVLSPPEVEYPSAFEKYETKTEDQLKNTVAGTSGIRTWEFPFIARAEGEYTIPSIEFSYFDPSTRSYKTLSSGAFNVKITKDTGAPQTGGAFVSGVTKEDLKMLGSDIRFIKIDDPELKREQATFLWSWAFFGLFGVIVLAFVVALYLLRRIIANRSDIVRTKNKRANKVALKRLKRAKSFMLQTQSDKFFEEMLRALWGYMGDKLAIEVADLTKERVQSELINRGVVQDQATMFLDLIGQCELAQYAPSVAVSMEQAYAEALEIIGSMELR